MNAELTSHTPGKRTTISDIARILGLDKSTVSRALRNHERVSQETQKQVRDVAERLNYRPSPFLSEIASHRWKAHQNQVRETIGLIVPVECCSVNVSRAVEGVRAEAQSRGFRAELFRVADYPRPERLVEVFFHRRIRAAVVVADAFRDAPLEHLFSTHAVVGCLPERTGFPFHSVACHPGRMVELAWSEARRRGYRRIATVIPEEDSGVRGPADSVVAEIHAFAAYQQNRLGASHGGIPTFHLGASGGDDVLHRWFRAYHPEVILGMGRQPLDALRSRQVRIPGDLGYINLRHDGESGESGIWPRNQLVGRRALELLESLLHQNENRVPASRQQVLVEPAWFEGDTCPAFRRNAVQLMAS